ncbi:MAG TPA: hypothetical protein DDY32_10350, partial [Desulfobulbaceae bacterium]|nr:hypothetical protein [Desulfobulbaceae bacterium]
HLSRLTQVLERELREAGVRRELEVAVKELSKVHAELEQRVIERTAEVQAASVKLRASHAATLNLMEDAVIARKEADEISDRLRLEIVERKNIEEALRRSE